MRKRTLGRTGLEVSELALGTVELGLDYGINERKPDRAKAAALLNQALDLGINLIDTARAYGDAEEIIGEALNTRRREYILLSKVPAQPDTVRANVEASLKALHTDHIDIMMIHCGADANPDEDTAAELVKLQQAGTLRYLGASVYGEEPALAAIAAPWCDCLEIAYNLLDRRPEARTLPRAVEQNKGIIARSVLLKGALTKRIAALPSSYAELKSAVDATQIPIDQLPELAYRYVLQHNPPQSALVGSANPQELIACIEYAKKEPLGGSLLQKIKSQPIPESTWLNPGQWPK